MLPEERGNGAGKAGKRKKKSRDCGVSEKIHVGNSLKDAVYTKRLKPARFPCGIYSTRTAALERRRIQIANSR
jgi:hypothetical protein